MYDGVGFSGPSAYGSVSGLANGGRTYASTTHYEQAAAALAGAGLAGGGAPSGVGYGGRPLGYDGASGQAFGERLMPEERVVYKRREPLSSSEAAPKATVGVDVNNDGRPDYYVTGADRNRDGIPDGLQKGGSSFTFPTNGSFVAEPYSQSGLPTVSAASRSYPSNAASREYDYRSSSPLGGRSSPMYGGGYGEGAYNNNRSMSPEMRGASYSGSYGGGYGAAGYGARPNSYASGYAGASGYGPGDTFTGGTISYGPPPGQTPGPSGYGSYGIAGYGFPTSGSFVAEPFASGAPSPLTPSASYSALPPYPGPGADAGFASPGLPGYMGFGGGGGFGAMPMGGMSGAGAPYSGLPGPQSSFLAPLDPASSFAAGAGYGAAGPLGTNGGYGLGGGLNSFGPNGSAGGPSPASLDLALAASALNPAGGSRLAELGGDPLLIAADGKMGTSPGVDGLDRGPGTASRRELKGEMDILAKERSAIDEKLREDSDALKRDAKNGRSPSVRVKKRHGSGCC